MAQIAASESSQGARIDETNRELSMLKGEVQTGSPDWSSRWPDTRYGWRLCSSGSRFRWRCR